MAQKDVENARANTTGPLPGSGYVASSSEEARAAAAREPNRRTVGELFSSATAQFSTLVRDEIQYTQASLKHKVLNLGMGGVLLAVAGVLALFMLGFLLHAAAAFFTVVFGGRWWAGYLTVAGILLLIIAVLVLLGLLKLKKSGKYPTNLVGGLSKDVDAVKKGLSK